MRISFGQVLIHLSTRVMLFKEKVRLEIENIVLL